MWGFDGEVWDRFVGGGDFCLGVVGDEVGLMDVILDGLWCCGGYLGG